MCVDLFALLPGPGVYIQQGGKHQIAMRVIIGV